MPNLIYENIFLPLERLIFGTFYIMILLAVKLLVHGFIVKLKLLDITRFLKGQDVRPY